MGADTRRVFDAAIDSLASLRGFQPNGDVAAMLHLTASLAAEAQARIPPAVAAARDQDCSWAQIADLLGVTRASVWQRYAAPPAAVEATAGKTKTPQPTSLDKQHRPSRKVTARRQQATAGRPGTRREKRS
jgi:hypothetical protein